MPETIITKRCPRCKEIKPITEFYKHKRTPDKHDYWCKICTIIQVKKNYNTKQGRINRYKYNHQYHTSEKGKRLNRKYYRMNPNRGKAKATVQYAVITRILPPVKTMKCSCSKNAKHYHHHKGYEKKHWLDVIPVCLLCHNGIHIKYKLAIIA